MAVAAATRRSAISPSPLGGLPRSTLALVVPEVRRPVVIRALTEQIHGLMVRRWRRRLLGPKPAAPAEVRRRGLVELQDLASARQSFLAAMAAPNLAPLMTEAAAAALAVLMGMGRLVVPRGHSIFDRAALAAAVLVVARSELMRRLTQLVMVPRAAIIRQALALGLQVQLREGPVALVPQVVAAAAAPLYQGQQVPRVARVASVALVRNGTPVMALAEVAAAVAGAATTPVRGRLMELVAMAAMAVSTAAVAALAVGA